MLASTYSFAASGLPRLSFHSAAVASTSREGQRMLLTQPPQHGRAFLEQTLRTRQVTRFAHAARELAS